MLEYKGYIGKVEIDEEAGLLHGEVKKIRHVVTFEDETVDLPQQLPVLRASVNSPQRSL